MLHAMKVLLVFQAKILLSLDCGNVDIDGVTDLRVVMDFALMPTKRSRPFYWVHSGP